MSIDPQLAATLRALAYNGRHGNNADTRDMLNSVGRLVDLFQAGKLGPVAEWLNDWGRPGAVQATPFKTKAGGAKVIDPSWTIGQQGKGSGTYDPPRKKLGQPTFQRSRQDQLSDEHAARIDAFARLAAERLQWQDLAAQPRGYKLDDQRPVALVQDQRAEETRRLASFVDTHILGTEAGRARLQELAGDYLEQRNITLTPGYRPRSTQRRGINESDLKTGGSGDGDTEGRPEGYYVQNQVHDSRVGTDPTRRLYEQAGQRELVRDAALRKLSWYEEQKAQGARYPHEFVIPKDLPTFRSQKPGQAPPQGPLPLTLGDISQQRVGSARGDKDDRSPAVNAYLSNKGVDLDRELGKLLRKAGADPKVIRQISTQQGAGASILSTAANESTEWQQTKQVGGSGLPTLGPLAEQLGSNTIAVSRFSAEAAEKGQREAGALLNPARADTLQAIRKQNERLFDATNYAPRSPMATQLLALRREVSESHQQAPWTPAASITREMQAREQRRQDQAIEALGKGREDPLFSGQIPSSRQNPQLLTATLEDGRRADGKGYAGPSGLITTDTGEQELMHYFVGLGHSQAQSQRFTQVAMLDELHDYTPDEIPDLPEEELASLFGMQAYRQSGMTDEQKDRLMEIKERSIYARGRTGVRRGAPGDTGQPMANLRDVLQEGFYNNDPKASPTNRNKYSFFGPGAALIHPFSHAATSFTDRLLGGPFAGKNAERASAGRLLVGETTSIDDAGNVTSVPQHTNLWSYKNSLADRGDTPHKQALQRRVEQLRGEIASSITSDTARQAQIRQHPQVLDLVGQLTRGNETPLASELRGLSGQLSTTQGQLRLLEPPDRAHFAQVQGLSAAMTRPEFPFVDLAGAYGTAWNLATQAGRSLPGRTDQRRYVDPFTTTDKLLQDERLSPEERKELALGGADPAVFGLPMYAQVPPDLSATQRQVAAEGGFLTVEHDEEGKPQYSGVKQDWTVDELDRLVNAAQAMKGNEQGRLTREVVEEFRQAAHLPAGVKDLHDQAFLQHSPALEGEEGIPVNALPSQHEVGTVTREGKHVPGLTRAFGVLGQPGKWGEYGQRLQQVLQHVSPDQYWPVIARARQQQQLKAQGEHIWDLQPSEWINGEHIGKDAILRGAMVPAVGNRIVETPDPTITAPIDNARSYFPLIGGKKEAQVVTGERKDQEARLGQARRGRTWQTIEQGQGRDIGALGGMTYAVVGGQHANTEQQQVMERMGTLLASRGALLRTTGQQGAQQAFERGATSLARGRKEVYLPKDDLPRVGEPDNPEYPSQRLARQRSGVSIKGDRVVAPQYDRPVDGGKPTPHRDERGRPVTGFSNWNKAVNVASRLLPDWKNLFSKDEAGNVFKNKRGKESLSYPQKAAAAEAYALRGADLQSPADFAITYGSAYQDPGLGLRLADTNGAPPALDATGAVIPGPKPIPTFNVADWMHLGEEGVQGKFEDFVAGVRGQQGATLGARMPSTPPQGGPSPWGPLANAGEQPDALDRLLGVQAFTNQVAPKAFAPTRLPGGVMSSLEEDVPQNAVLASPAARRARPERQRSPFTVQAPGPRVQDRPRPPVTRLGVDDVATRIGAFAGQPAYSPLPTRGATSPARLDPLDPLAGTPITIADNPALGGSTPPPPPPARVGGSMESFENEAHDDLIRRIGQVSNPGDLPLLWGRVHQLHDLGYINLEQREGLERQVLARDDALRGPSPVDVPLGASPSAALEELPLANAGSVAPVSSSVLVPPPLAPPVSPNWSATSILPPIVPPAPLPAPPVIAPTLTGPAVPPVLPPVPGGPPVPPPPPPPAPPATPGVPDPSDPRYPFRPDPAHANQVTMEQAAWLDKAMSGGDNQLLVAGPGAGKTYVIDAFFRRMNAERGVSGEQLLSLTHSKQLQQESQNRFNTPLVDEHGVARPRTISGARSQTYAAAMERGLRNLEGDRRPGGLFSQLPEEVRDLIPQGLADGDLREAQGRRITSAPRQQEIVRRALAQTRGYDIRNSDPAIARAELDRVAQSDVHGWRRNLNAFHGQLFTQKDLGWDYQRQAYSGAVNPDAQAWIEQQSLQKEDGGTRLNLGQFQEVYQAYRQQQGAHVPLGEDNLPLHDRSGNPFSSGVMDQAQVETAFALTSRAGRAQGPAGYEALQRGMYPGTQHGEVVLDEYQNTTLGQAEFVPLMEAGHNRMTAVGDPAHQSFSGYRGGNKAGVVEQYAGNPARDTFAGTARLGPETTRVAGRIFGEPHWMEPFDVKTGNAVPANKLAFQELEHYRNDKQEAQALAQKAVLLNASGVPLHEMIVHGTSNAQLTKAAQIARDQYGIPVSAPFDEEKALDDLHNERITQADYAQMVEEGKTIKEHTLHFRTAGTTQGMGFGVNFVLGANEAAKAYGHEGKSADEQEEMRAKTATMLTRTKGSFTDLYGNTRQGTTAISSSGPNPNGMAQVFRYAGVPDELRAAGLNGTIRQATPDAVQAGPQSSFGQYLRQGTMAGTAGQSLANNQPFVLEAGSGAKITINAGAGVTVSTGGLPSYTASPVGAGPTAPATTGSGTPGGPVTAPGGPTTAPGVTTRAPSAAVPPGGTVLVPAGTSSGGGPPPSSFSGGSGGGGGRGGSYGGFWQTVEIARSLNQLVLPLAQSYHQDQTAAAQFSLDAWYTAAAQPDSTNGKAIAQHYAQLKDLYTSGAEGSPLSKVRYQFSPDQLVSGQKMAQQRIDSSLTPSQLTPLNQAAALMQTTPEKLAEQLGAFQALTGKDFSKDLKHNDSALLGQLVNAYKQEGIDPIEALGAARLGGATQSASGLSPDVILAAIGVGKKAGVQERAMGAAMSEVGDLSFTTNGTQSYELHRLFSGGSMPTLDALQTQLRRTEFTEQSQHLDQAAAKLDIGSPWRVAQQGEWDYETHNIGRERSSLARRGAAIERQSGLLDAQTNLTTWQYGNQYGVDFSKQGYYDYQKAVLQSQQTGQPLPAEIANSGGAGFEARSFFGGIEHQRKMLMYSQSPEFRGKAYEEQMAELNRQSALEEEKIQHEGPQRKLELENQRAGIGDERATQEEAKTSLDEHAKVVQAQIAAAQEQMKQDSLNLQTSRDLLQQQMALFENTRPRTLAEGLGYAKEIGGAQGILKQLSTFEGPERLDIMGRLGIGRDAANSVDVLLNQYAKFRGEGKDKEGADFLATHAKDQSVIALDTAVGDMMDTGANGKAPIAFGDKYGANKGQQAAIENALNVEGQVKLGTKLAEFSQWFSEHGGVLAADLEHVKEAAAAFQGPLEILGAAFVLAMSVKGLMAKGGGGGGIGGAISGATGVVPVFVTNWGGTSTMTMPPGAGTPGGAPTVGRGPLLGGLFDSAKWAGTLGMLGTIGIITGGAGIHEWINEKTGKIDPNAPMWAKALYNATSIVPGGQGGLDAAGKIHDFFFPPAKPEPSKGQAYKDEKLNAPAFAGPGNAPPSGDMHAGAIPAGYDAADEQEQWLRWLGSPPGTLPPPGAPPSAVVKGWHQDAPPFNMDDLSREQRSLMYDQEAHGYSSQAAFGQAQSIDFALLSPRQKEEFQQKVNQGMTAQDAFNSVMDALRLRGEKLGLSWDKSGEKFNGELSQLLDNLTTQGTGLGAEWVTAGGVTVTRSGAILDALDGSSATLGTQWKAAAETISPRNATVWAKLDDGADAFVGELGKAKEGIADWWHTLITGKRNQNQPPPGAPRQDDAFLAGIAGQERRDQAGPGARVFPITGYQGAIDPHHGDPRAIGGSDLLAPAGSPVVSMVNGTVSWANYDQLGGWNVGVHGEDTLDYYYAHLQDDPAKLGIKQGGAITSGQQLGAVGNTGNAAGTPSHLHLGIGRGIQSGDGAFGGLGNDFDAVSYLRAVQSGTNDQKLITGNAQVDPQTVEQVLSVLGNELSSPIAHDVISPYAGDRGAPVGDQPVTGPPANNQPPQVQVTVQAPTQIHINGSADESVVQQIELALEKHGKAISDTAVRQVLTLLKQHSSSTPLR